MSYNDPDKQKKSQLDWYHKNKKPGEVTWEQLQDKDFKDLATWNDCVLRAKGCAIRLQGQKMKLAGLAIHACQIRHGGDRRTQHARDFIIPNGIKAFAVEVGVDHRTLQTWIQIKLKVFNHLPEDEQKSGMAYTPAARALTAVNQGHGTDHVTEYRREAGKSPSERNAERINDMMHSIQSGFKTYAFAGFNQAKFNIAWGRLEKIRKLFETFGKEKGYL